MSNIWLNQNSRSSVWVSSSLEQKLKHHFFFKNGLKILILLQKVCVIEFLRQN